MKKIFSLTLIASILLLLTWKGAIGLDPDFGWHMRSGFYFLENGIPSTDPFSYTMPSFPFIDHAWGTSILFSFLYPKIGLVGLSFLLSGLLIFSFFILLYDGIISEVPHRSTQAITFPLFIFSASILAPFFFVRAQVFSWFFWSIFVSIFSDKSLWNKYRFLLPGIFILWVNLHGGFALGIFSLLLYGIVNFFKKNLKSLDVIIIVSCIFATFINPYGIHIWTEVFMTVSSPLLRTNVQEWRSIIFSSDLIMFCFITFSTISIFRYWRKLPLEQVFLFCFLLLQSLLSLKNVPFWILLALPLTSRSLLYFKDEVSSIPHGKERFMKAIYILTRVCVLMLALEFFFTIRSAYSVQEQNFYPQKAIQYLKEHRQEGNVYSDYGWGGYLDWKYPEKKVFIDGRMAIWRWDNAPKNELSNAFKTYIMIGRGEASYKSTFDQFNITTILLPNRKEAESIGINKFENMISSFLSLYGLVKDQDTFDSIKTLESDGWQKVYEDNVSVIYQKPQTD
jgi:hypothetical protein